MIAVPKSKGTAGVSQVCACFDLNRDAWYKYQKRQKKREKMVSRVIDLVMEERKDQARVGIRKLYEALNPTFKLEQIKIGRDGLFDILREHNMLVRRKKPIAKPLILITGSINTIT